jgi:hypothetical protein
MKVLKLLHATVGQTDGHGEAYFCNFVANVPKRTSFRTISEDVSYLWSLNRSKYQRHDVEDGGFGGCVSIGM